jgi:hypothetical protein
MLRSSLFLVHLGRAGAGAGAGAAAPLALVTLALATLAFVTLALVAASREREGPGAACALPSGDGHQVHHAQSYANPCHHEETHGPEAGKHDGLPGESVPDGESDAVAREVMLAASPYEKVACDD